MKSGVSCSGTSEHEDCLELATYPDPQRCGLEVAMPVAEIRRQGALKLMPCHRSCLALQ